MEAKLHIRGLDDTETVSVQVESQPYAGLAAAVSEVRQAADRAQANALRILGGDPAVDWTWTGELAVANLRFEICRLIRRADSGAFEDAGVRPPAAWVVCAAFPAKGMLTDSGPGQAAEVLPGPAGNHVSPAFRRWFNIDTGRTTTVVHDFPSAPRESGPCAPLPGTD